MLTTYQGKRIFIKDITHYLVPPMGKLSSIAPSLHTIRRGVGTDNHANGTSGATGTNGSNGAQLKTAVSTDDEAVPVGDHKGTNGQELTVPPYPFATAVEPGNPTVVPRKVLEQFHFAFLIRHPKYSIPSYYRCTIPPLDEITGFYHFMPEEAGYDEQRRVFDYLRSIGAIGPKICGQESNGQVNGHDGSHGNAVEICVIDADDLLDNPEGILEKFCGSVGIEYSKSMLNWDNDEDHKHAKEAFEKWKGFHEDAINSSELKPRTHVSRVLDLLQLKY